MQYFKTSGTTLPLTQRNIPEGLTPHYCTCKTHSNEVLQCVAQTHIVCNYYYHHHHHHHYHYHHHHHHRGGGGGGGGDDDDNNNNNNNKANSQATGRKLIPN